MQLGSSIFLGSSAFTAYVLAGYPLALAWYARWRAKPISRKSGYEPRLTVVIPVRNGERWLLAKLDSLLRSNYPGDLLDILIVSDGSSDRTVELASNYPDSRVRCLALPPQGKASAVNRALQLVSSEIVVLTDIRQAFDAQAIASLVSCLSDPAVGVVTGELVIREGESAEEFNTGLYWRYEKWIRRNLNKIDAMLGATGAIYAIRRELFRTMPTDTLLDDVYIPFAAALQGCRIYFEDSAKAYDFPTSLEAEFKRKVRTQAGVYQIMGQFPGLLWPANRRFVHFVSHKLGRLLLPFSLLTIAGSSFFLPPPFHWAALLAQGVFYGAALVDPVIPEGMQLKRLTAITRAFLVLVIAAFCATSILFRPPQRLWKQTHVGGSAPTS